MPPSLRHLFRFQESGLLLVILALGVMLTVFSGAYYGQCGRTR